MNNITYIPAISLGPLEYNIKGKQIRFYQTDPTNVFYYPYLLISAGHNFKKNSKEEYGYDFADPKKIVLGDSGGYQIATGAIKYTPEIVEQIFNWLENNSNYAVNLDLPPFIDSQVSMKDRFADHLQKTVNNMTFFEKNQKGQTQFLNVLQGREFEHFEEWYSKVHNFNFPGGWGIGSATSRSAFTTIFAFFYLYSKGEIEKYSKLPGQKLFHFLGVSSMEIIPILAYIQKKLNNKGFDIKLTYDSSTPFMNAAYGRYTIKKRFIHLSLALKIQSTWNLQTKLPCTCPVCQNLVWEDIFNLKSEKKDSFNSLFYAILRLHNMYQLISNEYEIKQVINLGCEEIMESYFPKDTILAFKVIDKVFESDSPLNILYTHKEFFRKFNVENETNTLDGLFE